MTRGETVACIVFAGIGANRASSIAEASAAALAAADQIEAVKEGCQRNRCSRVTKISGGFEMRKMFVSLIALLLVTGCGDTSTGSDPFSHIGAYSLISVNGAVLPVIEQTAPDLTVTLVSGSVDLKADETIKWSLRWRLNADTSTVGAERLGTYTLTNNTVNVTWRDGSTDAIAYDEGGGQLTIKTESEAQIYMK